MTQKYVHLLKKFYRQIYISFIDSDKFQNCLTQPPALVYFTSNFNHCQKLIENIDAYIIHKFFLELFLVNEFEFTSI